MYRDDATLLDIAKAARLLADFLRDVDREAFFASAEKQSAVLYQVAVIGEAVKRLSSTFRKQQPHVPWRDIAGMRDRAIHGYDRLILDRVWIVANQEVPALLAQIESLLPTDASSN